MLWPERLQWLARGYRTVIFIELACVDCGVWRCGIEQEQEYYFCPGCQRPSKVYLMAEGITSRDLPFPWKRIEPPLALKYRRILMNEPDELFVRVTPSATLKMLKRPRGRPRKAWAQPAP